MMKHDIVNQLKDITSSRYKEIEAWFAGAGRYTSPFFYNSVDLRHSGFKLAPVDTNIFPAGFNNLTLAEREQAAKKANAYFSRYYPHVDKILLMSEEHTRNTYYLENLAVLKDILEMANKEVRLSNFGSADIDTSTQHQTQSGREITISAITRVGNNIQTQDGFVPQMILVNNDLTTGSPEILQNIEQVITPPLGFGWYQRRKTSHFEAYNNLARDFCRQFDIDPWLITTLFERCGVVDFRERKGIECVALNAEKTLHRIQEKYNQYGITDKPYVFIKSDKGTYGMGIMTASSADEVYEMNKNIRKKMATIKNGTPNNEVIIQEGVPTIDEVDGGPAEPMIYLIGGEAVGCFYRINDKRDKLGNLNASGMKFTSMQDHNSSRKEVCGALGLIAKLASHAAAWECYTESYHI